MAIIIPYNRKLKLRARSMRNNPTGAEELMWALLRQGVLKSFRFHRQKPLGNYIVDFYCTRLLLVIEIDGLGHADEAQQEYDAQRTAFLNGYGITVLRFWNNEVLHNSDGVYEEVLDWVAFVLEAIYWQKLGCWMAIERRSIGAVLLICVTSFCKRLSLITFLKWIETVILVAVVRLLWT